jgi:hypothetical protein
MTLDASGVSLSETGLPGGAAFSMTLKAGGSGPSEATDPPGSAAVSSALKASGVENCVAAVPGCWGRVPPRAGWGRTLGGRRNTVGAGAVDVEGLLLNVAEGRFAVPGGVAILEG